MKKIKNVLMLLLLAGCLAGCGGPKEIELNAYVDVEFEGYDTVGVITRYEIDVEQILADYAKELENVSESDLNRLLQYAIEFDSTAELTNGENVAATWHIDEEDLLAFEEANKVKLAYSDFTVAVENLEELKEFDPFEKISVEFGGCAPYVTASLNDSREAGDTGYRDFHYDMDQRRNLSNGDVVTVTVSSYDSDFKKHCIQNYGMVPTAQTKEFVVSGCPEYVTDMEKISSADLTKISGHIQQKLQDKAAGWVFPESYCGMTFMGNVFAQAKEGTGSGTENRLYFIYKVDIDSIRDGVFSYYYYGSIDNLYFDENGALGYDLANVKVPEMSSGWYVSGTYFEYCNLYYEGYLTYDELYSAQVQPLLEKYSVADMVDKGIITKQTHEARDYSKITATAKLGADCFTYKWHQGSYFVSGLTEKGYQELTKYASSEYVSLQLPAATEDGSAVEGMYSSKAEGGYSFTSLFAVNVPCIELVCPDSYTYFYGFTEDNGFDSNYGVKLRNIVLNEGLTEIAASAFKNCVGLEQMTIPSSVEIIPEQAFYGCSNLKKITIPDSVAIIEKEAFAKCSSLAIDSMEIGTRKIKGNAFTGVTIKTVTLSGDDYTPERYSNWGTLYASWNGAIIKKLVIADGVTQIPDYAFEGAAGITEITVPSSVTKIGTRAFAGNGDLTSVTLAEGLEIIGEEAFEGSTALKKLVIPSTVASIGKKAFANSTMLVIDSLEVGALKIAANAFSGVTFNTVTFTSDSYVPDRYSDWGTINTPWGGAIVKKLVIGDGITQIPDYAFEHVSGFAEVVIPSSVTKIGTRAFAGNADLKTVTFSEGLEEIGEEAFSGCTALKAINIPASLTTVKKSAFSGCTYLVLEKLELSMLTISEKAFYGVTIKELVLGADGYVPDRYSSWGTVYTPWDGAVIKKITINEGVTAIPDYAFEYCEGVTEVVLPSTVKTIGTGAFYHSSTLKTVTLNEGLEAIGEAAFKSCSNLKTVNIPSTVTRIDAEAFHGCASLLIDTLDISGKTIGLSAFYQAVIGEMILNSNEFVSSRYTSWGTLYSPWAGVTVKKITITENVTELPDYVFESITSVREVVVPASVTKIGTNAFTNSSELTILAPAGSAAEQYAVENGIAFTPGN